MIDSVGVDRERGVTDETVAQPSLCPAAAGPDFSPADVHGAETAPGIPEFPNLNASLVETRQIGGRRRQAGSCQRDYSLHKSLRWA